MGIRIRHIHLSLWHRHSALQPAGMTCAELLQDWVCHIIHPRTSNGSQEAAGGGQRAASSEQRAAGGGQRTAGGEQHSGCGEWRWVDR